MNLFNTTPEKSGYRLDYMEIFNWGTFHKEVYRISPQGQNSLLTGANASGKSTLVDALLTLLVPMKRNRFYNQSSGVEKKGARTEESYVLGCYGTQQEEGASGTTTMKLREKNARSVLLASFRNADDKVVTLFQVRYFSGQELKVVYGTARVPLEIKTDFEQFDARGEWRKRLDRQYNARSAKKVIDFFNGPSEYANQICLLFHMRSSNALTLFNQIVGVKVLDDLDNFIRHNMLDECAAEDQYKALYDNFQNLMGAKINIDKTIEQIKLLEPIEEVAQKLQEMEQQASLLEQSQLTAAFWFAARIVQLAKEQKGMNAGQRHLQKEKQQQLLAQKEEIEKQIFKLKLAIENDETSKQIANLVERVQELTKERDKRTLKANDYNELARNLDLMLNPSQEDFEQNRRRAAEECTAKQQELDDIAELIRQAKNKEDELKRKIDQDIETIQELEKNKNNISGRVSEIRQEILQEVGATPEEIPFIGELIRVKDTERDWQPAIERILHNFALRLIVPEKYYREVNEYVNSHHLNGRIVYQRYQDSPSLKEMEDWDLDDNHLLQKVEFKSSNRYTDWVEREIYRQYNYSCVENLEEFNIYHEKAVTREGLIKSVGNKHEKDDRKEIRSRDNYVLGWENKEKIAGLREEVRQLQLEQKENLNQLVAIENRQKEYRLRIDLLNDLLKRFEEYELIDWMSYAQTIQELEEQKKKLEEADNQAKVLREQLDEAEKEKSACEKEIRRIEVLLHDLDKEEQKLTMLLKENKEFIQEMDIVNVDYFEQQYPELLEVPLMKLEGKREEWQKSLNKQKTAKDSEINDLKRKATSLLGAFKRPSPELAEKYKDWNSDVSALPDPSNVDLIGEYQQYFHRLKEEDLVSYQKDFNQYLQENIYNNVNLYKLYFEKWEMDICKAIEQLNKSLRGIVFNKDQGTYIQLSALKKPSAEAREFYELLKQANPNLHVVDGSIDGRQRHFEQHIVPLMERLENEQWRSKVTDVRAWYTYRAEEFYQETGQRCKAYESMGQLSGGEKAQLTYTILGSAIAYQFGFTKSGLETSFRFIAIDEAFKAQDEDKARYLLDLCHQLHLQLLVVTPSDNIHIVEDYISFVHYVERRGNASVLYNMPILEYQSECKKQEE